MTAHVLLNPAARGGRNRAMRGPIERAFALAGLDATVTETAARGDAQRLAAELGEAGAWVVAAGGDGTVHEVANGLVGTAGVMSVLPVGTGNDFAAAVGTPAGLADAVAALDPSPTLRLDLGHARWTDADGRTGERWFANCLGMGFDAQAAALAAETKWLGGRAAYLAAVVRTLWASRRPDLRVSIRADGLEFDGPLFLCEVGNGHSIGGGFLMTPDARPDDGLLDVCAVRHLAPRRAMTLMPKTFTGAHVSEPEACLTRTETLTLRVTSASPAGVGIQMDGETLTLDAAAVSVSVAPGALAVRAPGVGEKAVAHDRYKSYPSTSGSTSPHARRP